MPINRTLTTAANIYTEAVENVINKVNRRMDVIRRIVRIIKA